MFAECLGGDRCRGPPLSAPAWTTEHLVPIRSSRLLSPWRQQRLDQSDVLYVLPHYTYKLDEHQTLTAGWLRTASPHFDRAYADGLFISSLQSGLLA